MVFDAISKRGNRKYFDTNIGITLLWGHSVELELF